MTEPSSILDERMTLSGHLRGTADLEVRGRVDGTLHLDATLTVAPSAVLKAEVHVRRAVVAGVVVGTIHAQDSVELLPGCRVVGDVRAPQVLMAEGALFHGRIEHGDSPAARAPSSPPPEAAAQELAHPPEFTAIPDPSRELPLTPPPPRPLPSTTRVMVKRR